MSLAKLAVVLTWACTVLGAGRIPVIDVGALRTLDINDPAFCSHVQEPAHNIYDASVNVGFFYVANHGVSDELLQRIDNISKHFFALPVEEKKTIDMIYGGKAWRGYFAVGAEVTSGIPDQKEGIYFGTELAAKVWSDRLPMIGISKGWDYVPIIAGGTLIALFSLEKLLLFFTGQTLEPMPLGANGLGREA